MTSKEGAAIHARALAKPEAVIVCLKLMATKISLDRDEPDTPAAHARCMEAALAWWEKDVLADIARRNARHKGEPVTEEEFARGLILRLRTHPEHGWSEILIGDAN